ncbi:hypothetical protein CR513_07895, partial [Mucuna pruriens]
MENQLTELTSLVRQLTVSQHQQISQVKVWGICTSVEHFTDMCPTLQEVESDNAELIGQLANSVSHLQAARSGNLPSQSILNPKGGNVSVVMLRIGIELQVASQSQPNN